MLRRVPYISRDVSISMTFKPLRPNGLLLYTSQYDDGRGDFLSLTLRHGYVEFRSFFIYNHFIHVFIIITYYDVNK